MTKESFIVFILGIVFVAECFICFLMYQANRTLCDALAKNNEVVINNWHGAVPEDKLRRGK